MNTVYNASAGTGKTYQVTRLYEKLVLEDGVDPHRILLMTFTDNAAAELRMRVTHNLVKVRRAAEAAGHDEEAERAITALSRLPASPIETIHSFCTRLLREYSLEAGLSPGFTVLVGDDRDELLSRICREELLARLDTDPDFKAFCAGAYMIGTGKGFGSSVTETVPRLIGEAGSLGVSLENAEAMLPPPKPAGSIGAFHAILERLHELPKPTATAKPFIQALEELLAEGVDLEALIEGLTKRGLKGKRFGRGKGHKPISDDFFDLFTEADDAIQYKLRYPAAKAFARYVDRVYSRFQQRKHDMDAVDFDDQLRMAGQLLSSGRAAPAFDTIIVDEVQDTSRSQCDIIRDLWGESTELVICGDRKQSIYTWRGADPQVMPDLERVILEANGKQEHLQTSYRSKPSILKVVNKLFAEVYGPDHYSATDHLQPNDAFTAAEALSCVEFLSPDKDLAEASKQDRHAAEMEAVANRIRLLVTGSSEWHPGYRFATKQFEPVSGDNSFRYSDVLILLRRTTHLPALEHALRRADIRYTLGGKGRGLFTRQETRDVSLLLNVITNPADTLSLIGFLRSPWVGLSDETITTLAWSDTGFSEETLQAGYSRETDVVDRYRDLLGTKLASELVRMLIDETGYDALLAGSPRGAQRLANLRKVLDWIRENERGARVTPAGVARKLAEKIANPPQVPEAALLDPAQNAVTIMTVHSAKGLTKRVVVIPDTSFSPDTDKGFARFFFDEEKTPGLGIRITAPDRSSVESPGSRAAKDRAKEVQKNELKNLFYVAMTRARDLVVTSATVGRKATGWCADLEPLIGSDIVDIPYAALREAVELPELSGFATRSPAQLHAALRSLPPTPDKPVLQRIPATRLAKESDRIEPGIDPSSGAATDKAAAMGSLGHAVLEQLALNNWEGSVSLWLARLSDDFGITRDAADALAERLERTRTLMAETTKDVAELRPELPFVLHDGERLIDGTIDLLCETNHRISIFDYKFTEAETAPLLESYQGQMSIYHRAAQRAFPQHPEPEISLVVVSAKESRMVPVPI